MPVCKILECKYTAVYNDLCPTHAVKYRRVNPRAAAAHDRELTKAERAKRNHIGRKVYTQLGKEAHHGQG